MNLSMLDKIDRRVIYLLVFLALSIPLLAGVSLKPARMGAADDLFKVIEGLEVRNDKIAFISFDFGPSTIAENGSQAKVVVEHLMRRRIPIALVSLTTESTAILNSIPEGIAKQLEVENPGERWQYGRDWVNLGFMAGQSIAVQSLPKAENLVEFFKKDVRGNNLKDLAAFNQVKTIENVGLLAEFTGSPGTLEAYIQFFQTGSYRPAFVHGCTSIMTPQGYIYLDSGQLNGMLEGIGGAAWYSELLNHKFPGRKPDTSRAINTGLGVAHLMIIALVIFGNLVAALISLRGARA